MLKPAFLLTLPLVCALFVGCSTKPSTDYSKVDLLSVSGTVTLDGNPLSGAVVTFESTETGSFSYGLTDSSGHYQLQFDSVKSGCTPGEKRVEISTTKKILGLNTDEEGAAPEGEGGEEGSQAGGEQERVPERFNKNSELTVTVSDSETSFDFDLKSDG